MDRNSIHSIIDYIKKTNKNFIIHTNINVSGYNTVSHQKFYGRRNHPKGSHVNTKEWKGYNTEIVTCIGGILKLTTDNGTTDFPTIDGGKRTIFLDTDCITAIEIIDETDFETLPVYIDAPSGSSTSQISK